MQAEVDKADFIESIKEKLFSKEQKKVDNKAGHPSYRHKNSLHFLTKVFWANL